MLAAAVLASASGCGVSDAGPAGETPPPPSAETAAPAAGDAAAGGPEPDTAGSPAAEADPPPVLREDTPPLVGIDGWLQSDVTSLEELRGSVVVVEFWTFGCYNCRAWQGRPAYWPRTYVLDRRGRVRFDHIGEGAYEELEAAVSLLLAEGP